MSRQIFALAAGAALLHGLVALEALTPIAPGWDGILHLAFAALYLVAGARLGELSVTAPALARGIAWALLVADSTQLAASAILQENLRNWFAVHVLAWSPFVAAGLLRLVRTRSEAAEGLPLPVTPEPPRAPALWTLLPPRIRGLVLTALGVVLVKGASFVFARRGGFRTDYDPGEGDIIGLLFAPGLIVALFGVIEFVLGRPFAEWAAAWNELPEGVQRLVVYGLLFVGLPLGIVLLVRYVF